MWIVPQSLPFGGRSLWTVIEQNDHFELLRRVKVVRFLKRFLQKKKQCFLTECPTQIESSIGQF